MKKFVLATMICSIGLTSCSAIRKQTYEPIVISSTPAGAHITIDGFDCGETPQAIEMSTNRSHQIVLEKQNYIPQNYLLKPKVSGSKLSHNVIFPIGVGALSAAGVGIAIATTTGSTLGWASLLIGGAGLIGLAAGGVVGIAGVGVDLATKKAQTFPCTSLHFDLE